MSRRIRVLCVDDHRIVREGISLIINRQSDMEVVALAASGEEAVTLLETHGCGWWVPHTTSHHVRALNQAVAMRPEQRTAMGRKGRTLVEQHYRRVDAARQSTQLYRWVLGQAEQPDFVVLD